MGAHSKNGKVRTTVSIDAEVYTAGELRAVLLYKGNFSNYVEALVEMDAKKREPHVIVRDEKPLRGSHGAGAGVGTAEKAATKAQVKRKVGSLSDVREISLSIFGTIPAGWPDDRSSAKPKRKVRVAKDRFPEGAFGLDVTGESMNKARGKYGPVLDGQTVILLPPEQREPKHGDIVAALCDGQSTLKRLDCKLGPKCVLRAESDSLEWKDCIRPAHELVIQGVMVGKL